MVRVGLNGIQVDGEARSVILPNAIRASPNGSYRTVRRGASCKTMPAGITMSFSTRTFISSPPSVLVKTTSEHTRQYHGKIVGSSTLPLSHTTVLVSLPSTTSRGGCGLYPSPKDACMVKAFVTADNSAGRRFFTTPTSILGHGHHHLRKTLPRTKHNRGCRSR